MLTKNMKVNSVPRGMERRMCPRKFRIPSVVSKDNLELMGIIRRVLLPKLTSI